MVAVVTAGRASPGVSGAERPERGERGRRRELTKGRERRRGAQGWGWPGKRERPGGRGWTGQRLGAGGGGRAGKGEAWGPLRDPRPSPGLPAVLATLLRHLPLLGDAVNIRRAGTTRGAGAGGAAARPLCHRCALETQSTYICKYIKHKHSFSVSKSQLCPARLRFCKATTVSMSVQPGNSDAPGTAPGTPGRATAPGPEGGRRRWGCEGGPQPGARPPISRPGRARRPLRGGAAKNPWRRRLLSGFLVDEDPFLPPNRKNKNGEGRTNRASERSRGACQGSCLPCRGGEDRAGIGGRVLGP